MKGFQVRHDKTYTISNTVPPKESDHLPKLDCAGMMGRFSAPA